MTQPTTLHPIHGLHHFAWRCRDAEETRHFYEDILGLPLTHVIKKDTVPSTGEHCPYVHIFFRMRDGSHIAFFDLGDDTAAEPSPNTPAWVNHIALRVDSDRALEDMKAQLQAHGIEVIGVTDHDGYIHSIYFFDPNGHRVELAADIGTADQYSELRRVAPLMLEEWSKTKKAPRHADWLHEEARSEHD
jgi:catechol 2,3-dioxygenase-like lactoylglutathione lyase family enzyme